jgi:hypothetical protein
MHYCKSDFEKTNATKSLAPIHRSKPASEGYTMFRRSRRRTIEALPTQGIALTVALGRSDLRVTKQVDSADQKNRRGEVGHGNESPEFATQVSLRGVVPQVEASNDRGRLVESRD